MSETQDPDKKIVFGIKRKIEGASAADLPSLIEAPFPTERTIYWTPVTESTPAVTPAVTPAENAEGEAEGNGDKSPVAPVGPAVVITQEVLLKVSAHVAITLDNELGGFLLGDRYRCPNTNREYVVIDQYSPAKFTEATEVSLSFTHEAWAQLHEELTGKFRGKLKVGWYHSHPRMDVFLSRYDMEIQKERFPEPWMCALVLEPEKHRGGFFCWRNENVNPNEPVEFYELLERNSRESVVAWTNYRGVDQSTNTEPVLSQTNTQTFVESPESLIVTASTAAAAIPARPVPAARPVPNTVIPNRAVAGRAAPPAQAEVRPRPPAPKASSGARLWVIIAAAFLLGLLAVWGLITLRNRQQEKAQEQEQAPVSATDNANVSGAEAADAAEAEVVSLSVDKESTEVTLQPGDKDVMMVSFIVSNPPKDLSVKLGAHDAKLLDEEARPGDTRFIRAAADLKREIEVMKSKPDTTHPLSVTVADASDQDNRTRFTIFVNPQELWPAGDERSQNRAAAGQGVKVRTEIDEPAPVRRRPRPAPSRAGGERQAGSAPTTQPVNKPPDPGPATTAQSGQQGRAADTARRKPSCSRFTDPRLRKRMRNGGLCEDP